MDRRSVMRSSARAEKATRIAARLDALYPETPIPLDHRDPFTLLCAVMLSAQTTDQRVNQVTPALFSRASTPEAMARLPVATIQRLIKEVGLAPTKARHIRRTAELLVERHGGVVPGDLAALEALPGVGPKTARVVLAQAFGRPAFPVDTHIHRLAWRWGLSSGRSVEQTRRDLERSFPRERWNRLHLQMIFFGREHCPARGHDPRACPICAWAAPPGRLREMLRALPAARRAPRPSDVPVGIAPHRGTEVDLRTDRAKRHGQRIDHRGTPASMGAEIRADGAERP
jgi:endonuclease-3